MKNKKKSNIGKIILIVVGILLVLGIAGILYLNSLFYNMNEKIKIKNENIILTVKNVSTYTIENEYEDLGISSLVAGDYYKVDVEITNTGDKDYTRLPSNFILVDKDGNRTISSIVLLEEDVEDLLPDTISPKQTVSGSLYFERELADNKTFGEVSYLNYESLATPGKLVVYPVLLLQ